MLRLRVLVSRMLNMADGGIFGGRAPSPWITTGRCFVALSVTSLSIGVLARSPLSLRSVVRRGVPLCSAIATMVVAAAAWPVLVVLISRNALFGHVKVRMAHGDPHLPSAAFIDCASGGGCCCSVAVVGGLRPSAGVRASFIMAYTTRRR